MRIIGHRGAAGLALENTRASFEAALRSEVDAVELDVRLTRDNVVLVNHDSHTGRVSSQKMSIRRHNAADLQQLRLHNSEHLLTLSQALEILGDTPVIIEVKDRGMAEHIVPIIKQHPAAHASFASFRWRELKRLRRALPSAQLIVLEHLSPFDIIHHARRLRAGSVGLNLWLMNPFTYLLAKRLGVEIYVYTLNHHALAWLFSKVYPGVAICTNRPDRLKHLQK